MATEIERQRYRSVVGHFATGVAVITGHGPGGPAGMTTNAVCSLSLDPILLLVCFDNTSRTLPVVSESGRFGVNVLRSDQDALALVFASKVAPAEKFAGVGWTLEDEVPVLDGVIAWLVCDLQELLPGGDHTIAIGAPRSVHHDDGKPLVWFRGAYGALP